MPELSQLACSINLGVTHKPLTEYNVQYTNKHVSCYICVPDFETSIAISLKSTGYAGPGLAAFVFIDGQYQANRNRTGLRFPDDELPTRKWQVDFKFRQKEELQDDEATLIGRGWTFAKLKVVKSEDATPANKDFLDNLGTIEVVVLRCKGRDGTSSTGHMIDISSELRAKEASRSGRRTKRALASRHRHDSGSIGAQLDGSGNDDFWLNGADGNDNNNDTQAWVNSGYSQPAEAGGWPEDQNAQFDDFEAKDPFAADERSEQAAEADTKEGWGENNHWTAGSDTNDKDKQNNSFPAATEDIWDKKSGGQGSASNKAEPKKDSYRPIKHTRKDYWAQWSASHKGYGPAPDGSSRDQQRNAAYDPYIRPEYTMSPVCAKHAQIRGIEAYVKTGRGARYRHAFGRPTYLDSMESPYAVFTFQYRTARILSRILKKEVRADHEDEYQRLKKTSRAQLEMELLEYRAAEMKSRGKIPERESSSKPEGSTSTSKPVQGVSGATSWKSAGHSWTKGQADSAPAEGGGMW